MPDNADRECQQTPPWLHEQPAIENLLHAAIDKLDSKPDSVPRFTLNQKRLPELFEQGEQSDLIWALLQSLFNSSCPLFSFHESKRRNHHEAVFVNARIRFLPQAEEQLRQWLNRPAQTSELQVWKKVVSDNKDEFPGDVSRLNGSRIFVPGKASNEIVDGFIAINDYINQTLTLRNLSARCFWQDSKFLDHKEELLFQLYPDLKIKTRPVLVSVYLPENIQGILFIENQDSYTQAIAGIPSTLKNMALIYSSGFKFGASRIRNPQGVSLHFHGQSSNQLQSQFMDWWYDDNKNDWPVYFWGDLDYAGMDILANLKHRFETIEAWRPGYQPMLELLLSGGGHTPEATAKLGQKVSRETACIYADEKLIPALNKSGRFVDQEWVFE